MNTLRQTFRNLTLVALPLVAMTTQLGAIGCASETADEEVVPEGDYTEDQLRKGAAEQWVYGGTLPHLESARITVSLTAHTARVEGLVPQNWQTPLPFYVDSIQEGGRTKISVVYPVATGASVNSQPDAYEINRVSPWVPSNSSAAWGGFPFIPFNRGIAFHGPITAKDGEWTLIRGPVSHGCQRMQGEHVVELAHLIGVDMSTKVYSGASLEGFDIPVTVLRKADTWQGKNVDVDYPALAAVKRPTENVKMFKTWNANDLKTFVCPLNKRELNGSKVIPANYCARKNVDKFDPAVGPSR